MNVLILTDVFHTLNGAERLSVQLAEQLNQREGVRADIASMYTAGMPGHPEAMTRLREAGVERFHFLGLHVHPKSHAFAAGVMRLRNILRRGKYDIVETYTVTPAIAASWATRGLRTRLVSGLHHVYEMAHHNGMRHKVWRFSVRSNRRARFYAISEAARRGWIDYSGTDPAYTRTVYNAIDDAFFEAQPDGAGVRRELGLPEDARIALFVGSVVGYKGVDTAIEALGPLFEQYNLHYCLAGSWLTPAGEPFDGEEGFIEGIREKIARGGWQDHVHFLGRRNDIPALMASSDVLVHPTRIEGFGLVLVEAMAAGLPVVASNVQGIPEVLEGTASLMTPPDDPETFRAAVVETLKRSPQAHDEAVAKGRRRAEHFRMQTRVDAMLAYFHSLVNEEE